MILSIVNAPQVNVFVARVQFALAVNRSAALLENGSRCASCSDATGAGRRRE
jgi:hypothetical protein